MYAQLGLIPRFTICQRCNRKPSAHIHHKSYGRLDDVEWLCVSCHVAHHKEERARVRSTDRATGHASDAE